jgi:LysM repeat protein
LQQGQTLAAVAQRYEVSIDDLRLLNPGLREVAGQQVLVPVDTEGNRYADRPRPPRQQFVTVRRGDTLSAIAARHRTTPQAIMRANNLRNDRIFVGQQLRVPGGRAVAGGVTPQQQAAQHRQQAQTRAVARTVQVRSGDTLWAIAQRNGTTPQALAQYNNLRNDRIYAGQQLRIPPQDTARR